MHRRVVWPIHIDLLELRTFLPSLLERNTPDNCIECRGPNDDVLHTIWNDTLLSYRTA